VTASRRRPRDTGARDAALAILLKVASGRGHSNALLAALPAGMAERDRALCTELVYGVLRRQADLDEAIGAMSHRPLAGIDASLLTLLRLAAYQILFLTRVPRPAAVDEAVRTARARGGAGAAAFANGVLRGLCRAVEAGSIPQPRARPDPSERPSEFRDWLAREVSFPRRFVERALDRYGAEEGEAALRALNRPAPLVLRPTSLAGGAGDLARGLAGEGVETVPSPVLPGALRVARGVPQATALFRRGAFYIQDEAAQMVALLLEPLQPSHRVVDLCAAPGGKILQAAERVLAGEGLLVAADRSPRRLRRLRENAARTGVGWVRCVAMEAGRPALLGRFDRVLLDAPCSGTGVIRRHPEIRWRRTAEDIRRHAVEQDRVLRGACDLLAPGGRLVYAVCSLEPEEGIERVEAILRSRPLLRPVDARDVLPASLHRFVSARGTLETLPHRDDVDGFFAAVMTLC
jgi:16S rRNA (cytosine967-C5)-methyltransferase